MHGRGTGKAGRREGVVVAGPTETMCFIAGCQPTDPIPNLCATSCATTRLVASSHITTWLTIKTRDTPMSTGTESSSTQSARTKLKGGERADTEVQDDVEGRRVSLPPAAGQTRPPQAACRPARRPRSSPNRCRGRSSAAPLRALPAFGRRFPAGQRGDGASSSSSAAAAMV